MEQTKIKDFLAKLLRELKSISYVKPEDTPNIDLYMDQVITFMDDQLESTKRYDTDKLLTKTMINNYTKNNLLPPPDKKKYSREHIFTLLFIYYYKNILSISDIQSILNPLTEKYFGNDAPFNMQRIYEEVFQLEETETKKLLKDLGKKYSMAKNAFCDFPEEDREFLHYFSFICQLSFDIYLKKMVIEKTIDDLNSRMKKEQSDNTDI